MKHILALLFSAVGAFALAACATTASPGTVTVSQQTWANATEDAIAIGLVPVFTRNPNYVASASAVAQALGSFGGTTLAPADVDAFIGKTTLSPADAKVVAGIVNAAWGVYVRRYQQGAAAAVRPDVTLFLNAVANGIMAAAAAVPKSS